MPRQKRSAPTATPRVRPVPRSPRGRTRFAHVVVSTRQPNGSLVERRRTRHSLTFTGDPVRFLAAAARLVPTQQPGRLMIDAFPAGCHLTLDYAPDDRGRERIVWITLQPADMPALFAYALRRQPPPNGVLFVSLDAGTEGHPLTVPAISVADLAQMPTASMVL